MRLKGQEGGGGVTGEGGRSRGEEGKKKERRGSGWWSGGGGGGQKAPRLIVSSWILTFRQPHRVTSGRVTQSNIFLPVQNTSQ